MITHKNRSIIFWLIALLILFLSARAALPLFAQKRGRTPVINEVMAANRAGLIDEDGDHSDWIEIYNPGSQAINMSGWALTDDPNQPEKWPFPDMVIADGEYLIVFASGKNRKSNEPDKPLHTNFRLRKTGEFLALHNSLDLNSTDNMALALPEQFSDVAYGRHNDELPFVYLTTATPGEANDGPSAWDGVVAGVDFSIGRGFYDTPFLLELSTETAGAVIKYTTDGSSPDENNGLIYNEPIKIDTTTAVRAIATKSGYLPVPADTHTYIFADDVLRQPVNPPGFPATWGIHNRNVLAYVKGTPVNADYEMDPTVVNDPRFSETFEDDLKSIPSLSLVTDVENLDIYANPRERGRLWERPVSVELFDPGVNQEEFQIDAGLRIHGQVGRNEAIPKHSFRLFFRGEYGATDLKYPLFPDSPVQSFDSLVLRAGTNRSYAGRYNSQHHLTSYTRDEWARRTQTAMSGVSPHGRFVHLYLNGLYWGLYNIVERPDSAFMAAYFGGQEEEWYVRDQDGSVSGSLNEIVLSLIFAAMEAGRAGFENPHIYSTVKSYIDTEQFSDYIILNWYAGNKDWPYNNWYAGVRNPAGQLQFFVWDAENILKNGADIRLRGRTGGTPTLDTLSRLTAQELEQEYQTNPIAYILIALMANDDFKMEFADRVYKHLFTDGALTDANARARWHHVNTLVDRAIVAESARWGDSRHEPPIDREDWLSANELVLAQLTGNADRLVALLREAGYYPPIDPPTFSQHGGQISAGQALTMSATGEIYYTTDGTDPRLPVTGAVSPTASRYTSPIILTSTTHLKARALSHETWSGLNEAEFRPGAGNYRLRFTEIMYNPEGGSDYEFLELTNIGDAAVSLSGAYLEGIDFTFPAFTNLGPSEVVVLVRNRQAFAERYPTVDIGGVYSGKLSNGGELITLKNIDAETLISVRYDDRNDWPISPDGRGSSLVLYNPDGDPNDPRNWRASATLHGSPGPDEPTTLAKP